MYHPIRACLAYWKQGFYIKNEYSPPLVPSLQQFICSFPKPGLQNITECVKEANL